MKIFTHVSISGIIAGDIWMPCVTCTKPFTVGEQDFRYSDGSRPSIRDMVLQATNDGDFRGASILDATVVFERISMDSPTKIIRERSMDIRLFPSVADCVIAAESEEYYAASDAMCATEAD